MGDNLNKSLQNLFGQVLLFIFQDCENMVLNHESNLFLDFWKVGLGFGKLDFILEYQGCRI